MEYISTTKNSEEMITHQLKSRGLTSSPVLSAFKNVDRAQFVPRDLRYLAYADRPLAIGEGQTISQPYIVGAMMEALELAASHRVLEIGGGSLYNAAVMAQIVDHVFSIEINRKLYEKALDLKNSLKLENISIKRGDGYKGWKDKAPFDRIILTAAPATEIPEALVDQLADGGKLIAPLGEEFQELILFSKKDDQLIEEKNLFPVRFVPMISEE